MFKMTLAIAALALTTTAATIPAQALDRPRAVGLATPADGIVRVRSALGFADTIMRLKQDISAKGITFFQEIDQSKLAAQAGIPLSPSTLLIFGNPALGAQFVTSKASAGIDWPVRLLVTQARDGQVWLIYTDFGYIARRHQIHDRREAFAMAKKVIASIAASAAHE